MISNEVFTVVVVEYRSLTEVHTFNSEADAKAKAVELANEYYAHNGMAYFLDGSNKKFENYQMTRDYFNSDFYHDYEDNCNVEIFENSIL
jgi:hypothetical protein